MTAEPTDRTEPTGDPVIVARAICLRMLTDRARTLAELAEALRRRGIPRAVAVQVLRRFSEVGLIDDAAFADQWVRSRHRSGALGRQALAEELRRKGVPGELATGALAEVDEAAERRRARELVSRRLRTLPVSTSDERARAARRLLGMLARKGYPAGLAHTVVREALVERGAEVEGFDGAEIE
jgi:regulatory protein